MIKLALANHPRNDVFTSGNRGFGSSHCYPTTGSEVFHHHRLYACNHEFMIAAAIIDTQYSTNNRTTDAGAAMTPKMTEYRSLRKRLLIPVKSSMPPSPTTGSPYMSVLPYWFETKASPTTPTTKPVQMNINETTKRDPRTGWRDGFGAGAAFPAANGLG